MILGLVMLSLWFFTMTCTFMILLLFRIKQCSAMEKKGMKMRSLETFKVAVYCRLILDNACLHEFFNKVWWVFSGGVSSPCKEQDKLNKFKLNQFGWRTKIRQSYSLFNVILSNDWTEFTGFLSKGDCTICGFRGNPLSNPINIRRLVTVIGI